MLGLEAALLRDWRTLQLVAHGPVLALGLVSLDIIDIVDMDMVDIVDFIDMIDIIDMVDMVDILVIDRCTGSPRSHHGGC